MQPSANHITSDSVTELDESVDEMISISDSLRGDISGPTQELQPSDEASRSADEKLGPDELLGMARNPNEWDNAIHSRVLKDPWHMFHMIYLSATHGLRKQFTRELRDAIFIPDQQDRNRIDAWGSTQTPPETYEKLRNASPEWIRKRCRHTIPPPHILYPLVRKVFSTYGPIVDPTTKQPLFSSNSQWKMARNILELIRRGFVSDPPGISLYTQFGIDKQTGLPMYRCIRGTNTIEGGVHTHIKSRLPKFGVSIRHVQASLLDFTLRHNLLVGTYNSTGQHYRGHFSIWTMNRIQELLMTLKDSFSKPIQLDGWVNGNMYIQTKEVIGILPIPNEVRNLNGMSSYHSTLNQNQKYSFVARMQNT
ncbi:hypothetical protein Agabi119p4_5024 [Agaricus bisporus var. burnettii]|uniref:Uncharacterized protein n=1 Tax=Agaricus bisporus var. burnettii TaxID=192524 RepID=A0A8H7F4D6_AGABI|nr:hypothetical protein Agabi119p4_5024 [Agaricus bisporus var. burnettii]